MLQEGPITSVDRSRSFDFDFGVDHYEKGREARIKASLINTLERLGYEGKLSHPEKVAS